MRLLEENVRKWTLLGGGKEGAMGYGSREKKGCFAEYRRFSGSDLFEPEKPSGIKGRPEK